MRALRIIAALLFPTSAQFAAGRYRRGAAFAIALVAAMLLLPTMGAIPFVAAWGAALVDGVLLRRTVPEKRAVGAQLLAILVTACVSVMVSVSIKTFWMEAFRIPAGSMIPTLEIDDHMYIDKRALSPGRGEVIVFKYPREPEKDFVKRVIAVAGDTIEVADDGTLVLNGKAVPRKHVDGPCEYQDYLEELDRWDSRQCDAWDETLDGHTYRTYFDRLNGRRPFRAVTVSDGYYVLGDNRDNSHDSRYWGSVPRENVRGTARIIWWSSGPDGIRWDRLNQRIR
jgi:signal peptidase I